MKEEGEGARRKDEGERRKVEEPRSELNARGGEARCQGEGARTRCQGAEITFSLTPRFITVSPGPEGASIHSPHASRLIITYRLTYHRRLPHRLPLINAAIHGGVVATPELSV